MFGDADILSIGEPSNCSAWKLREKELLLWVPSITRPESITLLRCVEDDSKNIPRSVEDGLIDDDIVSKPKTRPSGVCFKRMASCTLQSESTGMEKDDIVGSGR